MVTLDSLELDFVSFNPMICKFLEVLQLQHSLTYRLYPPVETARVLTTNLTFYFISGTRI